jgi:predicted transcriptional regulator
MDRTNSEGEGVFRRVLFRVLEQATQKLVHLGARLGRPALATVPVSAVMLSRVDSVGVEQPLEEAAQLLVSKRCVQLPVFENNTPVGVVTRDDIARGLEQSGPHALVGEAPRHNVITVAPSESLADVLAKLRAAPDSVAVVIDHGSPVGLLTVDKLVAYVEDARRAA